MGETDTETVEQDKNNETLVSPEVLRQKVANRLGHIIDNLDPDRQIRESIKKGALKNPNNAAEPSTPQFVSQEEMISNLLKLHKLIRVGFHHELVEGAQHTEQEVDEQEQAAKEDFDFELNLMERLKRVHLTKEVASKIDRAEQIMGPDHVFGPDAIILTELLLQRGIISKHVGGKHTQQKGLFVEFGTKIEPNNGKLVLEVSDLPYSEDDFFLALNPKNRITGDIPSSSDAIPGPENLTFRPTLMLAESNPPTTHDPVPVTASNLGFLLEGVSNPFKYESFVEHLPSILVTDDRAFHPELDRKNNLTEYWSDNFQRFYDALSNPSQSGIHQAWGLTLETPLDLIPSPVSESPQPPGLKRFWPRRIQAEKTTPPPPLNLEVQLKNYEEAKNISTRKRTVVEAMFDRLNVYLNSGKTPGSLLEETSTEYQPRGQLQYHEIEIAENQHKPKYRFDGSPDPEYPGGNFYVGSSDYSVLNIVYSQTREDLPKENSQYIGLYPTH